MPRKKTEKLPELTNPLRKRKRLKGNHFPTEVTEEIERKAWELRQWPNIWGIEKIAKHIGVCTTTVWKAIERMREKQDRLWTRQTSEVRIRHLNELESKYEEVNEKWITSGEVKYLTEARACLADIRKITGADAPDKIQLEGQITAAITHRGSKEEMYQYAMELLKQAEERQKKPKPTKPPTEKGQ